LENGVEAEWTYKKSCSFVLKFFSLPILAGGSYLSYLGSFGLSLDGGEALKAERVVSLIFGTVLSILGLVLLGGFRRWSIDKENKKICKEVGLFIKLLTYSSKKLLNPSQVKLDQEVRVTKTKNGTSRRTVYVLKIVHDKGTELVREASNLMSLRSRAESLSQFLNITFVEFLDNGEYRERKPDELDMSVAEMNERYGVTFEKPQAPLSLTEYISTDWDNDGSKATRVNLPSPASREPKPLFVVLALFSILVGWLAYCFQGIKYEHLMKFIFDFLGFSTIIPLIILFIISALLLKGLTKTSFYVSGNELRLRRKFLFLWKSYKIKTSELELVKLMDKRKPYSILLISDKHHISVGDFLPKEELTYLVNLIQYTMQK
jgi:hypothetical protein